MILSQNPVSKLQYVERFGSGAAKLPKSSPRHHLMLE
jgi:hypothetical protein